MDHVPFTQCGGNAGRCGVSNRRKAMSPPFHVSLVAIALIAALGSLPASAQRGGGGGFRGGFNRGFAGPGFNRGFVGPRFGFNRGFVRPALRLQPWLRRAALRFQPRLRQSPVRLFWASRLCRAGLRRAAALVVGTATTALVGLGAAAAVVGLGAADAPAVGVRGLALPLKEQRRLIGMESCDWPSVSATEALSGRTVLSAAAGHSTCG